MFTEVQIENYKSIQSLKIGLGRINVFIGENGCGKTNILEAIALASAAAADKLDNEFLYPRGIRVTEPEFMRSAFDKENITKEIRINLRKINDVIFNFALQNDNKPYSKWNKSGYFSSNESTLGFFVNDPLLNEDKQINSDNNSIQVTIGSRTQNIDTHTYNIIKKLLEQTQNNYEESSLDLNNFIIYSPENSLLHVFKEEGQVQPLGTKGEGLLKLLKVLNNSLDKTNEIKRKLEFIEWFDDFKLSVDAELERSIQIKDRYLDKELPYFNQKSSNEGFLFLMFYFALFVSDDTPKFFAIDNIENALNPKLCTRLIQELVELAKKYDKQVIFTTHNPAVLDGLDLQDDEQRLFVIYRNIDGHTKAKRVYAPEALDDDEPVPLSEAFMNGYIGGLPNNF